MGIAGEVLLEFRKFSHAIAVLLKSGELLVAPQSTTRLIISAGNIEVLDRLEQLEVCKGGLVATEEHLIAKMVNNGLQAFDCRISANFLVVRSESRSKDFINKGAVDNCEHLVSPSFVLRSVAKEFWLILGSDVLLNSKGLGDRIFAINNVRKVSKGDLARFFDSIPLLCTKYVALLLVGDAAVVEEVTSGITSGTTAEVPVAKDDLTFFIGSSITTTPWHRRTTAHRLLFELQFKSYIYRNA